jgi:hypothetical protein
MGVFPSVLVRDDRSDVLAALSGRGIDLTNTPSTADVVVIPQLADLERLLDSVPASAGVVALGLPEPWADLAVRPAGAAPEGRVAPTREARPTDPEAVVPDLLARVDPSALVATGALAVDAPATPLLHVGSVPVAAVTRLGERRVVVLAVRAGVDLTAPDAFAELLVNAVAYAAPPADAHVVPQPHPLVGEPAWQRLKAAVTELRPLQAADGSVPDAATHGQATRLVSAICTGIEGLAPLLPHDADYLEALVKDFRRWADGGFEVPDFLDSLVAFAPAQRRVDGLPHLVVSPMYPPNGNPDRNVEAVLLQVIWPDFIAELEAGDYSNELFLPIRFLDFTPGYDTNSAVLFPETVAMREVPAFTWGGIFADREAARFRRVVAEAASVTRLVLPPDAVRLVEDQQLAEQTFVMWDLIHDRTHMHGDLPFDPFMIKQRMPYFLYSLEELRCDLTAFRESVALERQGHPYARMAQYAILFDRIFRFSITGSRVRNYDGLGGQLLFAWLHQKGVLHWTDNRLSIEWDAVAEPVLELGRAIEDLYWRSIDRPKVAHWLAAYELVSSVVTPHPSSAWARYAAGDRTALPVDGPPKGLTDAVLADEFPLSMFFEALSRKMKPVIESTSGITGSTGSAA